MTGTFREGLFSIDNHRLAGELGHQGNHQAGEQAGFPDEDFVRESETRRRRTGGNTFYSDRTILIHSDFRTDLTGQTESRLTVSARGIVTKNRLAFRQCSTEYGPLGIAFRCRHTEIPRIDEAETAVETLAHFIGRPLSRRSEVVGSVGGVGIWGTVGQAFHPRTATCIAHTEGNQSVGFIFIVEGENPFHVLL